MHISKAILAALVVLLLPAGRQDAAQHATKQPLLLSSVVAFVTTRDYPTSSSVFASEIYVAEYQGSDISTERLVNLRRLTSNNVGDGFPALSPDGRKLVFDSNRLFPAPAMNTSDLFVMDWDGENVAWLARGSSATWSADGADIAYHASASGAGTYIRADPGSATIDSDIFRLNVDDAVRQVGTPINLTNTPLSVDDDPDWSPDGSRIVFTRHDVTDNQNNSVTAEIWVMDADGNNQTRLTINAEEERGPAWSPDGSRIVYACRRGDPMNPLVNRTPTFEICIMNADGSNVIQLTSNNVPDLTPTWSPDGERILFHRTGGGTLQLYEVSVAGGASEALTLPPGLNGFPNWGQILTKAVRSTTPCSTSSSSTHCYAKAVIESHARSCAAVGSPTLAVNHCWTSGWNEESAILPGPGGREGIIVRRRTLPSRFVALDETEAFESSESGIERPHERAGLVSDGRNEQITDSEGRTGTCGSIGPPVHEAPGFVRRIGQGKR